MEEGGNMKVEGLRYFRKLAEFESFTDAAAELGISQSALSASLKRLEDELGVRLLDRYKSTKVRLTPAGEAYYRHVLQALNMLDLGREAAYEAAGKLRSSLSVGTIYAMQGDAWSHALAQFRKTASLDPQIDIEQGFSNELTRHLKEGSLDFIFASRLGNAEDPDLEYVPRCSQQLVVAVNRANPLARRKRIELKDLRGKRVMSYREGIPGMSDVKFFADRAGISVDWKYESEITLCSMVVSNPGSVALFSYSFLVGAFQDVVCVPVVEVPHDFHLVYLVSRREEHPQIVQEFLDFMASYDFSDTYAR